MFNLFKENQERGTINFTVRTCVSWRVFKTLGNKNTNNGICDCHQPVSNRRINLFKQGENIFSCPCCRVEYTHDVYTSEIKTIIAKAPFKIRVIM